MRIKLKCPGCNRTQIQTVVLVEGVVICGECGKDIRYKARSRTSKEDPLEALKSIFGGLR
jgi:transcription elongation factor Elf1